MGIRDQIGGVADQKGGDFDRSLTHFSALKAPKNGNFWKFVWKIEVNNPFFALQAPTIWNDFDILENSRPILWKLNILLHNYALNEGKVEKNLSI